MTKKELIQKVKNEELPIVGKKYSISCTYEWNQDGIDDNKKMEFTLCDYTITEALIFSDEERGIVDMVINKPVKYFKLDQIEELVDKFLEMEEGE